MLDDERAEHGRTRKRLCPVVRVPVVVLRGTRSCFVVEEQGREVRQGAEGKNTVVGERRRNARKGCILSLCPAILSLSALPIWEGDSFPYQPQELTEVIAGIYGAHMQAVLVAKVDYMRV